MEIVRRVHNMKEIVRRERTGGRKIGFVPTMGYLHEGHMSLVRRTKEVADIVVVSVFVNPAQFEPSEDLDRYPRDLTRDADLCVAEGVDYVFAPEPEEMYPRGSCTFVEVAGLSSVLEGETRPAHFRGVTTVVLKLLEVVHPHVAAFGQKDAQQVVVVQRMVRDLLLDVEIMVLPIVRDDDGVAVSSRNVYLSTEERLAAGAIPRALRAAERAVAEGERGADALVRLTREMLEAEPLLRVDYVVLVDKSLAPVETEIEGELLLLVAVYAGDTRLIDNTTLRA